MNILILGSGGRETAICKNIFNANLFCYSNVTNPQIFKKCKHYFLFDTFSVEECIKLCQSHYIKYVIIGSEKYLDTDIVNQLEKNDIFCLSTKSGFSKGETSKIFARTCLNNCNLGLFNPDFIVVTKQTNFMQIMTFQKHNNNVVIKPDKPSGKGVKGIWGSFVY